jgi:hypothetical protein
LLASPDASAQTGTAKGRVVTISEVTIVGRVQKPIAAVDVSRIQPKLTLAELRQPFIDRIESALKSRSDRSRWSSRHWCRSCTWRAPSAPELSRGLGADVERWAAAVRDARGERLRVVADGEPELAALLDAIESAPAREAAIAELNDRTAELSAELDVGRDVPRAATRISLATGTACAVIVIATSSRPVARARPFALAALASVWRAPSCGFRSRGRRAPPAGCLGGLGRALDRRFPSQTEIRNFSDGTSGRVDAAGCVYSEHGTDRSRCPPTAQTAA